MVDKHTRQFMTV